MASGRVACTCGRMVLMTSSRPSTSRFPKATISPAAAAAPSMVVRDPKSQDTVVECFGENCTCFHPALSSIIDVLLSEVGLAANTMQYVNKHAVK